MFPLTVNGELLRIDAPDETRLVCFGCSGGRGGVAARDTRAQTLNRRLMGFRRRASRPSTNAQNQRAVYAACKFSHGQPQ